MTEGGRGAAPRRRSLRHHRAECGDLRDAPWPDGASEFVDVYREQALAAGVRYAVMVVNAYAGMPFSLLERAFAGVMLRDDPDAEHFDPRTVELKFALDGENGIFLPFAKAIKQELVMRYRLEIF
jgi:hypothetical protein